MSRDASQQLAEGTLALVDNQIDQSTGTIRLKGTFPNQDGALWPGEFVNIRLLARIERSVITVPSTALQRGPQGYYAYVVTPNGTAEMRPIEVGNAADGVAVVDAGLKEGETVVTAGQYRLVPGARVAASTAASR
jgi:multidrug efflux system membrane fusion protein